MRMLKQLFDSNKAWAKKILEQDPEFFSKLSRQQFPEYLWIGCSDSRVPANQIVDLLPGDLFVHRNVANVVVHTDLNCLSVMQFAVDILKVKHIMVVGHYGCSGVRAALRRDRIGIADNWLAHVQDVRHKHQLLIGDRHDDAACDRLCELNVIEQVMNVCRTTVIQDAWGRGQQLAIHGWIYGIQDGLLRDLNIAVDGSSDLEVVYHGALNALRQ
ncbi:MAG TPA: carbonate dehydratase [Steroidobacteraceae bacterium]|jgi:carbonic anhydrase|nr:carbonate dehydratase [Steroidobacteraceae bacterium]